MVFHFLDKDMMRKTTNTIIRPKLEYAKLIWSPEKKKRLTTLKERRERGDLNTTYRLMNDFKETYKRQDIILRKGEARYLGRHKKKLLKGICLNHTKK